MAREVFVDGEVSAGSIPPESGPLNPFDTHEFAEEFLGRFYGQRQEERAASQTALERADGILADLEEEQRAQAEALGLTSEEWAEVITNPNFKNIYHFCAENPTLSWAEARARWADEERAEDARWDQQLDRLNKGSQRRIPSQELHRIDAAEGRRQRTWRPPTKAGLLRDPRRTEKLKLQVARKEAQLMRATATEEEIAAAINVER